MFWRHLPEAQNVCSVSPRDGSAKAVAADGELAKRAKNQTDNGVRVGSVLRAIFQEYCLDWAHFAGLGVVELMVEVSDRPEVVSRSNRLSAALDPSGAEEAALVKSTMRSAMMPSSCLAVDSSASSKWCMR